MSYAAIVARIEVEPIDGAETLARGRVLGYEVAVDKSTQSGTLGLFFPTDGQLSVEFATANDLISRGTDSDGRKLGGYFSEDRRVRTQKFMKGTVRSEGFFCPLTYLDFIDGHHARAVREGDEFDTVGGVPICNKYINEATRRAMAHDARQGVKRLQTKDFPEHVETGHWQKNPRIPEGSMFFISEKLHGTSGRYGNVKVSRSLKWWQKLLNRFFAFWPEDFYKHLHGSRRRVLNDVEDTSNYYGTNKFRVDAVEGLSLKQDEVLYFELLGYTDTGKPIMGDADPKRVTDKGFAKQYTNHDKVMRFKYGCEPGVCRLVVYRITQGGKDLLFPEFQSRAAELGLETPPFFLGTSTREAANQAVLDYTDGPSMLDPSHIREGVAIRVEEPNGTVRFFKNKSVNFGILEGYIKDDKNHVDMEESS